MTLFAILLVGIFLVTLAALTMPPLRYGRFHWLDEDHGPQPIVYFAIRPPADWVRIEAGILGRCIYVDWGKV